MSKRKTKNQFILSALKIHGKKYDYTLVDYVNNKTKIKIICHIHGVFEQRPDRHLTGCGCNDCGIISRINKTKNSTETFIKLAKLVHNNTYDYSLVNYVNNKTKIKIICSIHGEFEQTPNDHLDGHGCYNCVKNIPNNNYFIEKGNFIHNNKYDYTLVEYIKYNGKIKIICPKHGEFEQIACNHLHGAGCPKCSSSKGEIKIREILLNNNIKFNEQQKFEKCKYKKFLKFDFYLPEYNMCIEYDGNNIFLNIILKKMIQN